ncbi:acetylxylan esterase [Hallella colorans]|uniref:acetylxylan esterase n=1 Tax=Hallella colorans TaxID=1703337 RepID=UPI00248E15C1|nr:acetylxylan esterase [Hallella colorans]
MRTSRIASLLLCVFAMMTINAQIQGKNINILVQPDHADWTYRVGETANFKVSVLQSGVPLKNAMVQYESGPVLYTGQKKHTTLKKGTMQWKGKMDKPGFYTLKVTAHINGHDYEGKSTVGFSPEKIVPATQCPDDFDDFWKHTLEVAKQHSLQPTMQLLPERCTNEANVYEISFVNDRPGSRIYGILSIPVKAGQYPALLRVPGAGVRPYGGDTYTAPGKAVVLEIGIHGIPVTMSQHVYDDLQHGALDGYWDCNLENRERNYYKRVVTGAVRAIDYLATLPQWDHHTLGVTGSSQGGFLSLATAALDNRVTFIGVVHDAMCDYESEMKGVAGGWPHYFYKQDKINVARVTGARYYDGVNFARRCNVPAWFSFGFNDEVVPPTSSYGVYNIYPGTKTLSVYPMTGHFWFQEQWDEWQSWIRHQLGVDK